MKNLMKFDALKFLHNAGFERPRDNLVDLTNLKVNSTSVFLENSNRPFVVNVDVNRIRDLAPGALRFEDNPFYQVCKEYLCVGHDQYDGSALQRYFEIIPPSSESLVFETGQDHQIGGTFTNLAVTLPWFGSCGSQVIKERMMTAKRHATEQKWPPSIGTETYLFGPVSKAKGEAEMKRCISVLRSIKNVGYISPAPKDHIRGFLLIGSSPSEFAILIKNGTHRAAALAALKHPSIPILLQPADFIRENDSINWPRVVAEQFTEAAARAIFDRILRGKAPAFVAGKSS